MVNGKTRVFALLGDPVAHSLSPVMQNAAFQVLGLDAVYVTLRCAADRVATLAAGLARAGGGGNATIPHKSSLAAALTRPSARVQGLGSANTFWNEDGELAGENTDVEGVLAALARLDAPATTWLVVGTGGSARAVATAAAERGAALAVRSRDAGRGEAFLTWAGTLGVRRTDAAACEVVINASPLGLNADDPLPAEAASHPRARVALDLVYAARGTPWIRGLARRGLRAADGREMLVAQGTAAFTRWFPRVMAPIEVMRAAVDRALR